MKIQVLTICIIITLCLLFTGIFLSTAQAQQSLPLRYKPTVIIDIQAVSEEARAAIISSMANLSKVNDWKSLVVKPGDSLSKIVFDNYGYGTTKYPMSAETLIGFIRDVNQLDPLSSIKVGQTLRAPLLPARPFSRGVNPQWAQVFDTASKSIFVAPTKDVLSKPNDDIALAGESLGEGETWIVKMSPQENEQFLMSLPDKVRDELVGDEIYSGPTSSEDDIVEVNVPDVTDFSTAQPLISNLHEGLSNFLSSIESQKVGKYYVLDFFKPKGSPECTHGDMVVDVAKQSLEGYFAGQLKNNIKQIQIDYFEDKDGASEIILEYIRTFRSEKIQKNLKKDLDNLKKQNKPTPEKKYIPLLYLQALYSTLISKPDTALISSSFFIRFDGYRVLPISYRSNDQVVLVSAVMNDNGSKIEEIETEPQKSFFDSRRELGVILVGAEREPGTPFGMISQNGDGVSCLGKGSGWGIGASCITPQKMGTSFSTPSISVQILLAKAFWNANNMVITAKEAKTRLLLSSDLNPAYVDRYASAGIPRLEKLLRVNGTFAETKDGDIVNISLGDSFIEVKNKTGSIPHRFIFQRGDMGVCGLQVINGQSFIFREAAMKWEQIDIERISLTINGVPAPLTFDEFVNQFKEIVTL